MKDRKLASRANIVGLGPNDQSVILRILQTKTAHAAVPNNVPALSR
jgi:hypothetical protein